MPIIRIKNQESRVKGYLIKVLIFLALFIIHDSLFIIPAYAKTATPSATPVEATSSAQLATTSAEINYQPLGYVSPQSPQYANLMVNNLLHAFSCLMVGNSPIGQGCVDYLKGVPVISSSNTSGGLLGSVININTLVIANPPIRTGQYLATIGDSLGLVKSAHAQVTGSGAGVLEPIINLWQVSRNISYIIMIIIFVIIGLMVMFRQRINPQTVISIQAALPGLVIGLILITFSYFLASVITDTAYLATDVVGAYFTAAQGPINPDGSLTTKVADKSVLFIFGKFVGAIGRDDIKGALSIVFSSMTPEIQNWIRVAAGLISFQYASQIGGAIGGPIGTLTCTATGPLAAFCAPLGSLAGSLILGIPAATVGALDPTAVFSWILYVLAIAALIFQMIRLLMRLINNYLQVIFLTITAPFHFMLASLPGRQGIAIVWIRNMLCNVLAFPAVIAVFYFAAYLLGTSREPFTIIGSATISGPKSLPLFGGLNLSFIKILLAYGTLVATPAIPDIVCQAIGQVGRTGQMIEEQISGAQRGGQGYTGRIQGGFGAVGGVFGRASEQMGIRPSTSLRGALQGRRGQAGEKNATPDADDTLVSR